MNPGISEIIEGCCNNNRKAQNLLFEHYAPKLLGVCMRYCNNKSEAEDIMQEGFIKIFSNIDKFRMLKGGTFEGWMKRIMINTALNHYRDNLKRGFQVNLEETHVSEPIRDSDDDEPVIYSEKELMSLVQQLPAGYKMVFNLYVFENYSHKEIAVLLDINVNTSKSQLSKARRFLRSRLVELKQDKLTYTV